MSWWKSLVKYGAPVAGAALGSVGGGALGLSPAIGGAIGGGLGGVLGSEVGGKGGIGNDLLAGGLGAAGGYLAGPTLADWAGTTPGVTSAAGASLPNASGGTSLDDMLRTIGSGSAMEASIPAAAGTAGVESLVPGIAAAAPAATAGADIGSGLMNFIQKNPALVVGVGGLGAQLLGSGNSDYPAEKSLNAQAEMLSNLGAAGVNGQLTPSAQVAFNDAVTSIKASYANMNLSGSTMEAQDIAAAKSRAIAASAQEGLQEIGSSGDLYRAILGYQQEQDKDLSDAIGNLISSIGYGQGAASQGAH